jgi:hypothetical protein
MPLRNVWRIKWRPECTSKRAEHSDLLLLDFYLNSSFISHPRDPHRQAAKMATPQDAWRQLTKTFDRVQKGGGPSPKGFAGGAALLLTIGGGLIVANNSLFNVDGGHRAIKYTRINGVGKNIYSEGMEPA